MILNNLFNTNDRKQIADAFYHTKNESRTAMVEAISDLKIKRNIELESLNQDLKTATSALEKAQQTLLLAQTNQHTAAQKVMQTKSVYSSRIVQVEAKLLACAPSEIDALIEQIKDEKRELASRPPLHHVTGANEQARSRSAARNKRIQDTNARLELLSGSIAKAEGLRLSTDEDISAGLQSTRESLHLSPVTQ